MSANPFAAPSPAAHLPPFEQRVHHLKNETSTAQKSPSSGRNTRMGRRVEKPMDPHAGGPSGQRDTNKHNHVHANK